MTEQIGIRINELCSPLLPVFLSEAETESYPYMVYDLEVTESRTKDGVYAVVGEAEVKVVSKDFDEAKSLSGAIADALEEGMSGKKFYVRKGLTTKDCVEQVWIIQTNYRISQKS